MNMAPGGIVMTLHFYITYESVQKAKGFVTGMSFQPIVIKTLAYCANS